MSTINLREVAEQLQRESLEAVNPRTIVIETLQRYDFTPYKRVFVFAIGKASAQMMQGAKERLAAKLTQGIVVTKYDYLHGIDGDNQNIDLFEAGHPFPDENSVIATKRVIEILKSTDPTDAIIFLISGGGSTLLTMPFPPITLQELRSTTQLMTQAGATINELNSVRKHIDMVKGGGVLNFLKPQTHVFSFILSDVVGDDLSVIASGPTTADLSTYADARYNVDHYGLTTKLPASVMNRIAQGSQGMIPETVKPNDPILQNVQNIIIGNNNIAAEKAAQLAKTMDFNTLIITTSLVGQAKEVGKVIGAIAKDIARASQPLSRPACLIFGGETTVKIFGTGKGGRNQELALAAARQIEDINDVLIYAFGTDGTDGETEAAGAKVDGTTIRRGKEKGLDARFFIKNNDAFTFFKELNDLIITGPTGTNVNDLVFLLLG